MAYLGLRTCVPDTTTEELLPWYAMGMCTLQADCIAQVCLLPKTRALQRYYSPIFIQLIPLAAKHFSAVACMFLRCVEVCVVTYVGWHM